MITLFILISLTLLISIYKIKKKCGDWNNFNPLEVGFGFYLAFLLSTVILIACFLGFIATLIESGILP